MINWHLCALEIGRACDNSCLARDGEKALYENLGKTRQNQRHLTGRGKFIWLYQMKRGYNGGAQKINSQENRLFSFSVCGTANFKYGMPNKLRNQQKQ